MAIDRRLVALALALAAALVPGAAAAHGDAHDGKAPARAAAQPEQTPFGIAGDPRKTTRTIAIDMTDEMRFFPARLKVKRGETIRFALTNRGTTMHEMVIGTARDLEEHAALMRRFPDMEHDAPHMAHVAPGRSGEIVWRFNRAGEFRYACLVAGHFEAGMVGRVTVE